MTLVGFTTIISSAEKVKLETRFLGHEHSILILKNLKNDRTVTLDLRRVDCISSSYFELTDNNLRKKSYYEQFQGHLRGDQSSLVVFNRHEGMYSGIISLSNESYYIIPADTGHSIFPYFVLVDDIKPTTKHPNNIDCDFVHVKMLLVLDNLEYEHFDLNEEYLFERANLIANYVNMIYKTLKINIVLSGIVLWKDKNPIPISEKPKTTLYNFLDYRHSVLSKYPNDNAQLISGQKFRDGRMGMSFKNTICDPLLSGGINFDSHANPNKISLTVAHELGHSFGLKHCQCSTQNNNCIMSPFLGMTSSEWSNCSRNALKQKKYLQKCLTNNPINYFRLENYQPISCSTNIGRCDLLFFCIALLEIIIYSRYYLINQSRKS